MRTRYSVAVSFRDSANSVGAMVVDVSAESPQQAWLAIERLKQDPAFLRKGFEVLGDEFHDGIRVGEHHVLA